MIFLVFQSLAVSAADSQASPQPQVSQDLPQPSNLDFANGLYARKMYAPAISEYEKFIQSNPKSEEVASARFRVADSYYFMKNYKLAISNFESFLKDYPHEKRRPIAFFRLGASKFNLKDLDGADKVLLNLSGQAQDPNIKSGSLFYMAKIDSARGRTDQSVILLNRILKGFPQTEYAAYAALVMGDYYVSQKKDEEAVNVYKVAAERPMPAEIADEAAFKAAELYFSRKKFDEAKNYYRKIYDKSKKDSPYFDRALLGLFYCEYQMKNLGEAVKFLNDNPDFFTKSEGRYEALYLLANLSFEEKNNASALEILDRILKDPQADKATVEKALFKKAMVLKSMVKKEEALQALQKIIDAKMPGTAKAHFERAEILSESGRLDQAAAAYQASLDAGTGDFSKAALYNLAGVNLKQGVKAQARSTFMAYAEKYPGDEDAQRAFLQAIQIDLDLEHFAAAVDGANAFIRKYPQSPWTDIAFYKSGLASSGAGKFDEASQAFRYVVSQYPQSPLYAEAVYGAAASLESAGHVNEALVFYEKFVQDFPAHALSKQALPHLAYLYVQNNNLEKAVALYEDILLNRSDAVVNSKTAIWLTQYLLNQSRYEEMRKVLDSLPKRFPNENLTDAVDFFVAESYLGLKDPAHAAEYYTQSIQAKPDGDYAPHATLGLGMAYAMQGNDPMAETNLAKAMRYDNEMDVALRARFEYANLKLKAGNLPEAAKAYMMVAVLYDDANYSPEALYHAGQCFQKLVQNDEAQKAFEELKTRYPKSEWAKKIAPGGNP